MKKGQLLSSMHIYLKRSGEKCGTIFHAMHNLSDGGMTYFEFYTFLFISPVKFSSKQILSYHAQFFFH